MDMNESKHKKNIYVYNDDDCPSTASYIPVNTK